MTIEQGTRLLMGNFAGKMGGRKSTPSPPKKEPKEKKSAANKPPEIFSLQTFTTQTLMKPHRGRRSI